MSLNVLIITENDTYDQHIARPVITKILSDTGKSRAKIGVCARPRFDGIEDCTNTDKLVHEVISTYSMVDIFILLVDRDLEPGRDMKLARVEDEVRQYLKPNQFFITGQAFQEIEVWAIAGHDLLEDWRWSDIRNERDSKELYYMPLARSKGYIGYPFHGRKQMTTESLKNWARVKRLCIEDIGALISRIDAL